MGGCTDLCGFTQLQTLLIPSDSLELDFFSRVRERGEQAKNAPKSQQWRPVHNIFATIRPASGLLEQTSLSVRVLSLLY